MADVRTNLYDWSTVEANNLPVDATTLGAGLADNMCRLQATIRAWLAHKGADIASAATTDIGAVEGFAHDITGTTTVTGFGTVSAGIHKVLQFDGALTLTHNSTSLVLPGGANITTAAGDVGWFISEGSGNWRCLAFFPATGSLPFVDSAAVVIGSSDKTKKLRFEVDGLTTATTRVLTVQDQDGTVAITTQTGARKNAVINGDFSVVQRGTSFTSATTPANSDDTYLLDRWTLLSDGNDIVDVTQETTTVPTSQLYAIALDVETINKKFGIIQFIEQKNCVGLIGQTVTLSFKAKVSSTTKLDNLKAAIIAWDGTADTVTSDVVSAWGVEGTNPTLAANWTYENTPANLNPTTSYATYTVSAAVDTASAKNIAVFIWSDVTDTTLGDFLYITDVQLELGSVATPFERRSFKEELELCQRYFEKSYSVGTAPGTVTAVGNEVQRPVSTAFVYAVRFKVNKRAAPTMTGYSPTTGTAGQWRDSSAPADFAITFTDFGETGGTATGTAGSAGNFCSGHWAAVAEL
jgi:hypothetical protein